MDPSYPMYEVLCKLNNIKYKKWKFKDDFKLYLLSTDFNHSTVPSSSASTNTIMSWSFLWAFFLIDGIHASKYLLGFNTVHSCLDVI